MFRQLDDFFKAYQQLTEGSGRMFGALTDECLDQPVGGGHRTLGQIAWHIVTTIPEMMTRTGLGLCSVDPEASPPVSAAEIAEAYQRATAELTEVMNAYSTPFRPPIPWQTGHPFHAKSATDSTTNRPPIPRRIGHLSRG